MNSSEEWQRYLDTLSFDDRCIEIKNKIAEGIPDDYSKQFFIDCFNYVYNLYKQNKVLDVNLLKIHLEDIKGYKHIKFEEMLKIMFLLAYCGFSLSDISKT